MVLGLDLQGGVHFVLQVDQKAALEKRIDAYAEDIRVTLRDNRIGYQSVERRPDNSIVANLSLSGGADAAERARAALVKIQPTLSYDVSGNRITVTIPQAELQQIAGSALEQNITTPRNRVNELGVAEPIIQRQVPIRIGAAAWRTGHRRGQAPDRCDRDPGVPPGGRWRRPGRRAYRPRAGRRQALPRARHRRAGAAGASAYRLPATRWSMPPSAPTRTACPR